MTKRRVERLLEQAKENGHGDDGLREVVVELAGVPGHDPVEDGDPPTEEDVTAVEWFTIDLETGETERPDRPDPDDLPECANPDCPNPAMSDRILSECDKCEKCLGMPRRDWRPVVRENEEDHG